MNFTHIHSKKFEKAFLKYPNSYNACELFLTNEEMLEQRHVCLSTLFILEDFFHYLSNFFE